MCHQNLKYELITENQSEHSRCKIRSDNLIKYFNLSLYMYVVFFSFPVEEWRSKWFLERRWQKCGTDELIKAMNDINDHVRLAAVSACSKAAELRQIKKDKHHLGKHTLHVCVAVLTPVWKF